jgi:hypothetical protein
MNPIAISSNKRFLTNHDQSPFFWLADTAWELIHRLREDEVIHYFETRSRQGFNVTQVVLVSELDGIRIPNALGNLPFSDMESLEPDELFFEYVDRVVAIAARFEMHLALVPCWGDKVEKKDWGIGPEIWTAEKIFRYGEWLGRRYRDVPNLVWINGGDRSGGGFNRDIWDALANGIRKWDTNHLMTFHPWGETSSSFWFHDSSWLDFNACQSGHAVRAFPNYMMIESDYCKTPVKPCIDLEPRYEAHPINWKPELNGRFDDYDVRQAAYHAVFAGAAGHTYGAHPVWQMADKGRDPIGFCNMFWKEALELPGAKQMQWLKNLVLSRPYMDRKPDQSIVGAPKTGDEHIRAGCGSNYLMVYIPNGGIVSINLNRVSGELKRLWWFDPRNGEATEAGTVKTSAHFRAEAPSAVYRKDWVLVADDADKEFEPPGFPTQKLQRK